MVDYTELAIADCLKHPELGVISHQPDVREPVQDKITVRDIDYKLHTILASECEWAGYDEAYDYWRVINERLEGER